MKTMTPNALPVRSYLLAITLLFAIVNTVSAQTFFTDEFDGDVTQVGREPVRWVGAFGSPPPQSMDGNLILGSGTFTQIGAPSTEVTYTDVSLRSQLRLVSGSGSIGLAARWNESQNLSYAFGLNSESAFIGVGGVIEILAETPVDLDVTSEDVAVRFDVIEDQLLFWAWPANDEQPAEPLLTASDSRVQNGKLFLWTGDSVSEAQFRFLEVAPIPEPSCAVLGLVGVLGLLTLRRRRF